MKLLVSVVCTLMFLGVSLARYHPNNQDGRATGEFTESETNHRVRRSNRECSSSTTLLADGLTITSPSYPFEYGILLNRCWIISAPTGDTIRFDFNGPIDIEDQEGSCDFDYLKIYDGSSTNDNILLDACGQQTLPSVSTTGDTAYVYFSTDDSNEDPSGLRNFSGFSVTYTFVSTSESSPQQANRCTGTLEATSPGQFTSPGYPNQNYGDNSNCGYKITAPAGQVVKVTFSDMAIEAEPSCLYDSLSVYDGNEIDDSLLGSYCGTETPQAITSTGNKMLLKFVSDDSITDKGFQLEWEFETPVTSVKESPACGPNKPHVMEKETGTFSSQGFNDGRNYGDNLNCAWRVVVPTTMRARLQFTEFQLEQSDLCRYDKFVIYDGFDQTADMMGPYCGDTSPGDITGSGNALYVVFKSDDSVNAKGFQVQFSGKDKPTTGNEGGTGTPGTGTGSGTGEVKCGLPSIEPKFGRIVGGQTAIAHSWPWQISMRLKDFPSAGDWGHWCGGSIIDGSWILTAAHCVVGNPSASAYRIIAGDHDRVSSEDRSQVTVNVKRIIVHNNYIASNFDNDIALMELESPLTYTSEVSPVCLPGADIPDRTICVTTGWGATKGTADNTYLQQVQVPTLSRSNCNRGDWYGGAITQNMICAGYPEGLKDACQGDSGGPFVCIHGGTWKLYGATSWGFGCAEAKKPGVYTRVVRYTSWVESQTGVQFTT